MIGTLTALQWFIYDGVKVQLRLPRPPPAQMPEGQLDHILLYLNHLAFNCNLTGEHWYYFTGENDSRQPSSPPCGSTAWPPDCSSQQAHSCRPISPAYRREAGWTSSHTGHRSPWAAPCSPWCSCTSWPSWGESSAAARISSWARSDSSAP